ncbi:MAG: hypothetical protein ABL908_18420 [Hyphomicrobium sp.]
MDGIDHDEHQARDAMGRTDFKRVPLADDPSVVEPDHDVRDDLHARFAESGEGSGKLRDGPVEVVDRANGLIGADDVEHRRIDPASAMRRARVRSTRAEWMAMRSPGKSCFRCSMVG